MKENSIKKIALKDLNLGRFSTYHSQFQSIIKLNPKKVLEIGRGFGVTSNLLKETGIKVTSLDIDADFNPDILGDVRNIPFKDNEFDCVIAFEILEHIPLADVPRALSEIQRVSKRDVIISVPYSCYQIELLFKITLPRFRNWFNPRIRIPLLKKLKNGKEHFWELGRDKPRVKEFRALLMKYFIIKEEFSPELKQYNRFFVLEKLKTTKNNKDY